jgi:hypothetical protein
VQRKQNGFQRKTIAETKRRLRNSSANRCEHRLSDLEDNARAEGNFPKLYKLTEASKSRQQILVMGKYPSFYCGGYREKLQKHSDWFCAGTCPWKCPQELA